MKSLMFALALVMAPYISTVHAENASAKSGDQKIVDKIKKRDGYCSPLEKAQGKCHDAGDAQGTDAKLGDKIKKRDGYCSPLDKALKKC